MISFPNPEDTITVGTAGCGRLAISQAAIPFVYGNYGDQNGVASGLSRGLRLRFGDKPKDVVVMAGDGQVTLGESVIKHGAKKIRRLYQDKILAGFAGSTADAFTLFSRFESKLEQYHGNLGRSAVELAKDWRTDKFLRHLEALLLVSDKEATFLLSGQGDVIEPDTGIAAIGSGGPFAQAAAQALADHTKLSSREIAEEAMKIASRMCIYTNDRITIEEL